MKLYESAVQCHEADIEFISKEFIADFGRKPLSLREDFGGTAAMAVDWVKQGKEYSAHAVDLDPEPQEYGMKVHYATLSEEKKVE